MGIADILMRVACCEGTSVAVVQESAAKVFSDQRPVPSAAKAGSGNKPVTAVLKRCATQNQIQRSSHLKSSTAFSLSATCCAGVRPATALPLGNAFGRIGFEFSFIGGIQPDARYSRRFLEQVAGGARSVSCHDRTCGQGKAQRVCLVVKIQNHL